MKCTIKIFEQLHSNRDENFYAEFPARPVRRACDK